MPLECVDLLLVIIDKDMPAYLVESSYEKDCIFQNARFSLSLSLLADQTRPHCKCCNVGDMCSSNHRNAAVNHVTILVARVELYTVYFEFQEFCQ